MTTARLLFDEISHEPEFKQKNVRNSLTQHNLQNTQKLFDAVENDYKPSTVELFDSLEDESVKPTNTLMEKAPVNFMEHYRPEELTSEQLKNMTAQERLEYAQGMREFRKIKQGSGFAKGALSGLTIGASEHIPGLKPDEEDLLVHLGETVGSFIPISKLYSLIGKPLVSLAAKSPVARHGLEALARMTGFGLTGATHKAAKETIATGELPSPDELLKTGAQWAAFDAVLQSLGLGVAFSQSVKRIAAEEGITAKEVLGKLWDATKRRFKKPILPNEISEAEVEALVEEASKAEKEGLSIEVEPEAEIKPREEPIRAPEEEIASNPHKMNSNL